MIWVYFVYSLPQALASLVITGLCALAWTPLIWLQGGAAALTVLPFSRPHSHSYVTFEHSKCPQGPFQQYRRSNVQARMPGVCHLLSPSLKSVISSSLGLAFGQLEP